MSQKIMVTRVCGGLLAIASLLLASSVTWSQKFTPSPPPAAGKALIYVYRIGHIEGAAGYWRIFVNGDFLASLHNSNYASREVPEGTVVFAGVPKQKRVVTGVVPLSKPQEHKEEMLRIEVEAGKTYYVEWYMHRGARLKLVDGATGAEEIKGLNLAKD